MVALKNGKFESTDAFNSNKKSDNLSKPPIFKTKSV